MKKRVEVNLRFNMAQKVWGNALNTINIYTWSYLNSNLWTLPQAQLWDNLGHELYQVILAD